MSGGKQITYEDLEELLKNDNKVKVGGRSRLLNEYDNFYRAKHIIFVLIDCRYRRRRCHPREICIKEEVYELGQTRCRLWILFGRLVSSN